MTDEPVFTEPWEAQAFALVVSLHERGQFAWPDWTALLGEEIASGDDYYRCWLRALERLVTERGLATPGQLEHYRTAWERAAERTPHGTPIELAPGDF
ncbi:MAG TPA: nitrile hydratase accessory protein [Solirubrobacter sp.]|nr:nitrile hydratase accessory protein [Solirubrobacter sp.]